MIPTWKSRLIRGSLLQITAQAALASQLAPWAISPLPLGSIRPQGWLRGEMEAMANGMEGHMYDFYFRVNDSKWLYPTDSGKGVEFAPMMSSIPYWINGLVPLAYSLDDERLKNQVHDAVGKALEYQAPDGWIGPENITNRNFWTDTPFIMGMTQLAEANSTWTTPIVDSLNRYFNLSYSMISNNGTGMNNCKDFPGNSCQWGQARIHDMILNIQWMLENHPSDQDSMLWEMMGMMHTMTPVNWEKFYTNEQSYPKVVNVPNSKFPLYTYTHGVNVGQGLKANAIAWRMNQTDSLMQASENGVNWVMMYHGSPSGSVLGDEIETGLAPYRAAEFCTTVETGYSMSYLYHSMGNNDYADKAERVIFNSVPAHQTGNHWGHQYMEQSNQPWANNNTEDFTNGTKEFTSANCGYATTFGLESQFPCCTVNHPQGYPKFLTNSWGKVGDNGIAHVLLSPSKVSTSLQSGPVSITCNTDYPFNNKLEYDVSSHGAFDFYVRIPTWNESQNTQLSVSGRLQSVSPDPMTGLQRMSLPAGNSKVAYTIGVIPRTEARSNNTVSVYMGSLLYSLYIEPTITTTAAIMYPRGPFFKDLPYPEALQYYFTNNSAWNIAIDPSTLQYHGNYSDPLPTPIFDEHAPPNYMTVQGCPIKWDLHLGVTPDWAPEDRTCIGDQQEYKLIPHGAASLHMAELPVTSF